MIIGKQTVVRNVMQMVSECPSEDRIATTFSQSEIQEAYEKCSLYDLQVSLL